MKTIKVGDIYKDGRGGLLVVHDIIRDTIWYWEASKYGIRGTCCMDTYFKLLTKVEI